ncbi:uncharacterized protein LOC111337275, partial [Stylophora pistillata]|uniref:uncharacterized protein LOC111337275 n=1 Tax=Stylophora pistillata TaxID=50429 RepID=UPI000C041C47
MESFSIIWYLFLLVSVQLLVRKAGATITWTKPTPPHTQKDNKIRTTTKGFKSSVSEIQLEWQVTVSPGELMGVSWLINGDVIGLKQPDGKVTVSPKYQTEFSIISSDQATLVAHNVTAADGRTFNCEVQLTDLSRWNDKIKVVIY